ncbi:MAG TPA: dienelactone hydrolase family protein [Burkholderiaceae bacterium]|nr:dienelactone hydrolase family protein [Burkholderiaceae bacterium]
MSTTDFSATLALIPKEEKPNLLFVLLHGEAAGPEQLYPLVQAIQQAFPTALVILPPLGEEHELDALTAFVRKVQKHYGISGERTALAGFSQGARLVLEASRQHGDLAGRVLAFSGLYSERPASLPPTTMIHLFHGADDKLLPLKEVEEMLQHLGSIDADVTVDVASTVGHEIHPALIEQAIVRLQTCVPLRSWKEAYGELSLREGCSEIDPSKPPTLH